MISRRILAAIAVLCMVIAPAHAQKSKSTMTTELNTNWPDNSTGAITPAILRSTVVDIINSYVDWLTCTGTGGLVYWNGGTPTCLTAGTNGQVIIQVAGVPAWGNLASGINAGAGLSITGTISPTIFITNAVSPTTVGAANAIPQITFNTQGEITATSQISPTVSVGNITSVTLSQIVGNISGVTASLTPGQVGSLLCPPVRNVFTSGAAQTYTTPTCNSIPATWLEVDVQGGGSGGGGSGTTNNVPTAGNASSFGVLTASGASIGSTAEIGSVGGACSGSLGTQQNFPGANGGSTPSTTANSLPGGYGANSFYGGGGAPGTTGTAGGAAQPNSGSGGAGGSSSGTASVISASGGGAGCHIRTIISPPNATYTYTVGAAASGGSAGSSGFAGGGGAAGLIDVIAHWQ